MTGVMIAALLLASAQADHEFAGVTTTIDPAAKVGSRRAGVLCAPSGSNIWRAVRPTEAEMRETLGAALARTAPERVALAEPVFADLPSRRPHRITATISAAELDTCAPAWALGFLRGPAKAFKGDGVLTITWRIYGVASRTLESERTVTTRYRFDRRVTGLSELILSGLADNAAQFVRETGWAARIVP